jgi:hypothetical protein
VSVFQLRDATILKGNFLSDLEMFDCVISGTIENCALFRCKIKSSRLLKCKLEDQNELEDSKLEKCTIHHTNILKNCYIKNEKELVDGTVIGGVIRSGVISDTAEISKETLIVDAVYSDEKKDSETLQNLYTKRDSKKDTTSYIDIYKNKSFDK